MYCEALSIIDHNTANYMIEELQKELEEKQNTIKIKNAQIAELEKQLAALKKN